jgi:chitinase
MAVSYNGAKYTTVGTISVARDCPPGAPYNPSTDNWWRNDGACTGVTATATATASPRTTPTATTTPLPAQGKVFVGYWENWQGDSGDTWIPLNAVNDKYNVLIVAFPTVLADGTVTMTGLEGSLNPTASDVAVAHSRGKKVLISIGGALGSTTFSMTTQPQEDNFVASIIGIVDAFQYDGIDIDIERNLDAPGPPDNPGGSVQHVINACNRLKDHYGSGFMLTFAPETANTVGAIGPCGSYGGIWGNYLPIFNALKSRLSFVHMQYYNTAGMFGLDCQIHDLATQDSISAWTEAMIEGFPIGRTGVQYTGLDPTQVVIGLPAWVQPGATYDAPTTKAGWKCLTTGACGSGYQPRRSYPTLRGLMTWDVNIDQQNAYGWIEPLFPCVMTGACN